MKPLWAAYGLGHYGKSLMWHSSELLFAFYLTEVAGMAPVTMAFVIAICLCASGAMDVLVGQLLRRHVRTIGNAAAVQLLGASGAGTLFFLFLSTERMFGSQEVSIVLAIGLAFRLAYAVYDVPQNAVLGLAPGGHRLRARVSALRFICSSLASLTLAAGAPLLLTRAQQAESFGALGFGVGAMAIGTSLLFRHAARRQEQSPANAYIHPARGGTGTGTAAAAWHTLALPLGLAFAVTASSGVFMKLEPYFAAHLLDTASARGVLMMTVACGGIVSQVVALWACAHWPMPAMVRLFAAGAASGALGFLAAGTSHAAWASAAAFAVGFGLSGLGMLLWTALADATAAPAAMRSAIAPTLAFGLLTCSQKTASALSVLLIGTVLGGNDPAVLSHGLMPVVLAMGSAPLAGALICLGAAPRLKPASVK